MWKLAPLLLLLQALNTWDNVQTLKPGSDIRIYKKNGLDPTDAKFASLTDQKLTVIIRNKESAIDKEQIERIDYHPPAEKTPVTHALEGTEDSVSLTFQHSSNREGWRIIYKR